MMPASNPTAGELRRVAALLLAQADALEPPGEDVVVLLARLEAEDERKRDLVPLSVAAHRLGVAPDSLRARCRRGMKDDNPLGASELRGRHWWVDYAAALDWVARSEERR